MIVFRQKYPRWWFDWKLELMRFANRVCVYVGLMDDRYPSTDEQQSVLLELPYPDAKNGLNRWLPIVKAKYTSSGILTSAAITISPCGPTSQASPARRLSSVSR